MRNKILVSLQTFCEHSKEPLAVLEQSGADIVLNTLGHRLQKDEIIRLGQDCDGIIAAVEKYDADVLGKLGKLTCISRCGAGIDSIDVEEARKRNIIIFNTPDAVIQPVAEMTVAMIFGLLRLLVFHSALMKSGVWKKKSGYLLRGRKIGIIGLGKIGKRVAEILVALQADVYGCDIHPDTTWAKRCRVNIVSEQELLANVDIVCLHVSVVKEHAFSFGEEKIYQLKKGSMLINTSRGNVVDELALHKALSSGHLSGAGLDVYSKEPYTGPLQKLDNVILTPHISTLTEESRIEMEMQAVKNIVKFFKDICPHDKKK